MPTASSPAPPDNRFLSVPYSSSTAPDNRHLAVSNLSRNDSLRSERSDKRVSFNNDVGIKHIPRGSTKAPAPPPPTPKIPTTPDEWAECAPIKLQPNKLTAAELEREAADLVNLVDSINCKSSPLPLRKNKEINSRSLDRSQRRNNNNRNEENGINYTRITNPIIKHLKADVNRRESQRRNGYSDSDSERYRSARHKSVPNLVSAAAYEKNSRPEHHNGYNFSTNSVENLVDYKNTNITHANRGRPPYKSHLSADNLLDAEPVRQNINGYRSVGDIPNSDSDSTDLSHTYRPKVSQIIGRTNSSVAPGRKYNSSDVSTSDRESSPSRRPVAPNRRLRHNNNKPFSYTQHQKPPTTKHFSPLREVPPEDMYAQVDKNGLRQKLSMDSDYSAKIIITEDRPKNPYEGDDEAYETYQVQNNAFRDNRYSDYGVNLSRYDFDSKNNALNNNINMSSVAVQTEMSKAMNKNNRPLKGRAPSPPSKEPFTENYRKPQGLTSDLTSADLVRQINHGFGRFDRSPSPPPRRGFGKSNPRHVIPLLSDTSDSEPEYRRRSDPLKKIRNQVLLEGSLQEDHDEEEWEERQMLKERRNTNHNQIGMRPLTIDEIDALSLEVDQHGDRKLVVSKKADELRSSTLQTTHRSNAYESQAERSYSEERGRTSKPLREKTQHNREVSSSREKTLERNHKNNLEKEKQAQEKLAKAIEKENEKKQKDILKSKNKEKKAKEQKEKKKKRIKIKFFYDPRPQDKPNEDPLSNFSEYKGTDKHRTETVTTKTTRSRSYDSRSPSRERKNEGISSDPRYYRDSSRERTLSRQQRSPRLASKNDREPYRRSGSGNDRSSHDESNDDRKRRVRSSESFARRDLYDSREKYEDKTDRPTRYDYDDDQYDHKKRDYSKNRDSYDREYDNRENFDHYGDYNGREEYRNIFLKRREAYERRDSRKDSFTERKPLNNSSDSHRLDDSDRNWQSYNSPSDEAVSKRDDKNFSSPDEDDKQERVMRQRKKFLSALMTDGRAKSSNPPSSNTRGDDSEYKTATLKRSQSSAHDNIDRRYANEKRNGHESDPQPPSTSGKQQEPPKKSNLKPKKKKKKSWSWGFLGLRGNKRKKGRPASKAGSEAGGSNYGTAPLKRGNPLLNQSSRPTSRASSHRSSTRPRRPSVRASKIRKDGGNRSFASRSHDQRERREWESATLQRPAPNSSSGYYRSPGNSGGQRRTSEGSSASSASPRHSKPSVNRNTSFKQRYFGESEHEAPQPRTSGPGDYRSLPARSSRTNHKRPGRGGSAGSSLQSSESENDSHQGSRASHVSTGSNRSVYLHATAVADIPVQKDGESSDRPGVQRQSKKVSRSFSLLAPWKPRHPREPQHIDYDARDTRHAKPPRPPRRSAEHVSRSQTLTNKDSKLSGWLKKKKGKEGKGI